MEEPSVVDDLRARLSRRASRAVVGGFRSPADPLASWFGKVNLALPGEDWPTSAGRPIWANKELFGGTRG